MWLGCYHGYHNVVRLGGYHKFVVIIIMWFLINEDGGYHNVIRCFFINEDGGYHNVIIIMWLWLVGYHNVVSCLS